MMKWKRSLLLIGLIWLSLSCRQVETQNQPVDPNASPSGGISLLKISPNQIFSQEETTLTVTGSGFDRNMTVFLGSEEIKDYVLVDPQTIQLKILPQKGGVFEVILKTSNGNEVQGNFQVYSSRPVWKLTAIPDKIGSWPILHSFFNEKTGRFLVAIRRGNQGRIDLYEGSPFSYVYSFPTKGIPPALWDPIDPNQPAPFYPPDLVTLALGEGGYFGIVDYKHYTTLERDLNFPTEVLQITHDFAAKTAIPLPSQDPVFPLFFPDLGQKNIYALSVFSDTSPSPNHVRLWEWDGTNTWKSLLSVDYPAIVALLKNSVFTANADPSDPFLCIAFTEKEASCSRLAGAWKSLSFADLTTGKKITSFAYDPKNKILFASEDSGKILASRDFEKWELWGEGSLGDGIPQEILFDREKDLLLVITDKAQVYSSFRGGEWILLLGPNDLGGLGTIRNISRLIYHPLEKRFYAVITYDDPKMTPDSLNPFPWQALGSFSLSE